LVEGLTPEAMPRPPERLARSGGGLRSDHWGVVGGLLFTIPILGGVLGAGVGALAKMTKDAGITKDDLRVIRTEVVEGTSALCVVTEDANLDRLAERMRGVDKTLVSTNLTGAEHETLLETFGGQ
jgi:uncharacterized membrane protein